MRSAEERQSDKVAGRAGYQVDIVITVSSGTLHLHLYPQQLHQPRVDCTHTTLQTLVSMLGLIFVFFVILADFRDDINY